MVNRKCSVTFCPGKPRDKLTYYCFPKNPRIHQEWILACNKDAGFSPSQASRVCELHFQIDDFVTPKDSKSRRRLKDGVVPSLNLQNFPKLNSAENIEKFMTVPETFPGNVDDLEMDYKPMNVVMSTTSSKDETFDLDDPVRKSTVARLGEPALNEDKAKRKKWTPPKFKISSKDVADLPEDGEITRSIISSDEQAYYLSFMPQTEKEISSDRNTTDRLLPVDASCGLDDDDDLIPDAQLPIDNLSSTEKIERLTKQLNIAYKKNATLARKNKSLRLQFYAACKKTLSQKAKMEVAKDVLKPFFTPTQIDCFCRPSWLRSRNWAEEDFQIALSLRKLMSKKAFGYLRKKRMVPMPSLTSLRKYNKIKGIVLQHNTMRVASSRKNLKNSKKVKPQDITKGVNSKGGNDLKTGLKRTLVTSTEKQMQQQSNQQPILITSSGELGNVEFLQQTVDDQTGHVITTTLPMMTTTDGTTVVQLSTNTDEIDDGIINYANGQTVQMVMVDPTNPNQFTLQQHPIVATSSTSSPVTTLTLGDVAGQPDQVQQQRSFSRIKTNDSDTWKFIQIG